MRLKVFETVELASRYLNEVLNDAADPDIRANEDAFHRRLKSLTDILPQFADIWIVDANGRPVVSGTVFPIPRELNLSDRDYFRAHANNAVAGSLHRRRGDVARDQRARSAALLCAQPQARRRGRRLRRRHGDLGLAGLFPRLLRDADAAPRRRPDPRRWRGAGALSGAAAGCHPADAGFHRAARAASARPAPSPAGRRSTARSASMPSASCRASTSMWRPASTRPRSPRPGWPAWRAI